MRWIVGLGNPGTPYQYTRHNVGFMAIDMLAERFGIPVSQNKFKAQIGEGNVSGCKVVLIKPMTYMNLSGESLRAFMDFYKADLEDLLVIYDDLDTELGKIRLRYQGSPGGHNGIKSIIQHSGTQVFNRIRIGISRPLPGKNIADYVLSDFAKAEAEPLQDALKQTVHAAEDFLKEPFEKTMARYNR
ncbi:peptidyl-tRNA hydrolase [Paenibacillus swuensis]|uniref:Peptidyl-tRNA hydrolase n=1 Tax=Paenibacillus swuensis TaxID=1178515 RepID=A0A172TGA5_9BACL|nr:aminoacyl-tRNA hydrolase [Paenibacillus swuensis]ANE45992.1 peptidyl-tRNA hydrolase [Paenibacillus swuensis]